METGESRCSSGFNSWTTVFLIYIDDICNILSANVKVFADDTSLFSIVNDARETFDKVSNDLY